MRWEGNRESENVEDRRGSDDGGGGGFSIGGRGIGLGSIVIALIASAVFGVNPLQVLSLLSGGAPTQPSQQQSQPRSSVPANDPQTRFVKTTLGLTEDVWQNIFQQAGGTYQDPTLVIFRGSTRTACGQGQTAMGPFYCPADQRVYIDLDFYDTLKNRLGAPGDFAQAYVIAHEVGHHVQNLLGTSAKVDEARRRMSDKQSNALSVRLELQADCYAGVWAMHANQSKQILETGDVEEALNAASQIGDDALQQHAQGHVVPDSFTHGTSHQRVTWFKRGLDTGDIRQCDTFRAAQL